MANDPYNLTPNPFPSGKGDRKGFVGLRSSYPPHPLSLGKGGTEKRISSPDFKLANFPSGKGDRNLRTWWLMRDNLTPNPFPSGKGNRIVGSNLFPSGNGNREGERRFSCWRGGRRRVMMWRDDYVPPHLKT
jgi:hypothetical protein